MKAKSLGERDSKTSRTPWHWQKELLDRESFKRERCLGENRRQQSPLLIGKIKWCEAPAGSALRLLSWLTASCAVVAGLIRSVSESPAFLQEEDLNNWWYLLCEKRWKVAAQSCSPEHSNCDWWVCVSIFGFDSFECYNWDLCVTLIQLLIYKNT